jgi:two-component system response regulator HydG
MRVAPLRERLEDVAPLVEYFLGRHDDKDDGPGHALTPEALRLLEEHLWPGNVRELENLIERLVVTSPTREIGADAVRAAIAPVAPTDPVELLAATSVSFDELEKRYSDAVLRLSRGNKAKAASILGIDVSTLYRRGKPRR